MKWTSLFLILLLAGCQSQPPPAPASAKRKPIPKPKPYWAVSWTYEYEEPNSTNWIQFRVYHRTNLLEGGWILLGITNGFSWPITTNLPMDFFHVTATNTYGHGESP